MKNKLKFDDLVKYQSTESISEIDKKYTKAEILSCIATNDGYKYKGVFDKNKELEERINSDNSEINMAKRMIMSFLGEPTESDDSYPTNIVPKQNLVSLVGRLMRFTNDKGQNNG